MAQQYLSEGLYNLAGASRPSPGAYKSAPKLAKFRNPVGGDLENAVNPSLGWNSDFRMAFASSEERQASHKASFVAVTPFGMPASAEGGQKLRRRGRHPVTSFNRLFAKASRSRESADTRDGKREVIEPSFAYAERSPLLAQDAVTRAEQRAPPLLPPTNERQSRNRSPIRSSQNDEQHQEHSLVF